MLRLNLKFGIPDYLFFVIAEGVSQMIVKVKIEIVVNFCPRLQALSPSL